jgi:sec-independent protein translocase protein TatA
MSVGPPELLILLLIVLLLFGASRLPKLARSMREARDEFQKGSDEGASPSAPPAAAPPVSPPAPAPPVDIPPPAE